MVMDYYKDSCKPRFRICWDLDASFYCVFNLLFPYVDQEPFQAVSSDDLHLHFPMHRVSSGASAQFGTYSISVQNNFGCIDSNNPVVLSIVPQQKLTAHYC